MGYFDLMKAGKEAGVCKIVYEMAKGESTVVLRGQEAKKLAETWSITTTGGVNIGVSNTMLDTFTRGTEVTATAKKAAKAVKAAKRKPIDVIPAYNPEWKMSETQAKEYQWLYSEYQAAKVAVEGNTALAEAKNALNTQKGTLNEVYGSVMSAAQRYNYNSIESFLNSTKDSEQAIKCILENKLGGPVQETTINMIRENLQEYAKLSKEIEQYAANFRSSDKGLVRMAGLFRGEGGKIRDLEYEICGIRASLPNLKADKKLLEQLELTTAVAEKGKRFDTAVDFMLMRYGVKTPKEAYNVINAKIALVKQYDAGLNNIQASMEQILAKDKTVADLQRQLDRLQVRSPEVKQLRRYENILKGKYGEFMS